MRRRVKTSSRRFPRVRGTGMMFAMKRPYFAALFAGLFLAALGLQGQYEASPAKKSSDTAAVRAALIDINHASAEELKQLPGIADAYAAAIIRNRPYANKAQLNSRQVIPAATYKRIRARIIAKQ